MWCVCVQVRGLFTYQSLRLYSFLIEACYLFISTPTGSLKHKNLTGEVVSSQVYADVNENSADEEPDEAVDEYPPESVAVEEDTETLSE